MQRFIYGLWIIFIFIFFMIPATVLAQTGSIVGVVTDERTGDALAGANLRIENTSGGTATDVEGRYSLRGLAPGSYTLIVSYLGYETKRVQAEVDDGRRIWTLHSEIIL